ncbi:hypothetical protein [Streptomyces sp. NRRL S-350]|uniref:hypothetical protein n=1 Tax=Streptomyces sp. NRRL S-350 TaxID=1463902 RepID=UPI0004C0057D|nr:hypothetical protein [Streptomyces sp. NRRL S-350]
MNMPLGATRRPDTATVDGATAGANGSGEQTGSGTDGSVDGTAQESSGPSLDGAGDGAADAPGPDRRNDRRNDPRHDRSTDPGTDPGADRSLLGCAEWDLLTDGIRWNAETYLLLGCDPDHGPLSLDRLPDRLPEADRPLLRRVMTDALVHGRVAAGTLRVRRPCGRHHSVEYAGEPVLGVDGTVTALRMLLRPAPPD